MFGNKGEKKKQASLSFISLHSHFVNFTLMIQQIMF